MGLFTLYSLIHHNIIAKNKVKESESKQFDPPDHSIHAASKHNAISECHTAINGLWVTGEAVTQITKLIPVVDVEGAVTRSAHNFLSIL